MVKGILDLTGRLLTAERAFLPKLSDSSKTKPRPSTAIQPETVTELLGCEKNLTVAATDNLYARYDEARSRAQRLDTKHAGDGSPPRSNPSSDVWRLIDRANSFEP